MYISVHIYKYCILYSFVCLIPLTLVSLFTKADTKPLRCFVFNSKLIGRAFICADSCHHMIPDLPDWNLHLFRYCCCILNQIKKIKQRQSLSQFVFQQCRHSHNSRCCENTTVFDNTFMKNSQRTSFPFWSGPAGAAELVKKQTCYFNNVKSKLQFLIELLSGHLSLYWATLPCQKTQQHFYIGALHMLFMM